MSGRTDDDPLARSATPVRVRAMAAAAGLSAAATDRALELVTRTPPPAAWRRFLATALAGFGAGLLLSGVVSFIAFNWARIGRFGKFALVEMAIAGAVILAWKKLPRLSGQIALFGAAALVGPLLALYGQTYQTGADPWGLFFSWALLILPWAIAGRFGATWVLVLLLLDVARGLYVAQVDPPRNSAEGVWYPLSVALLHGIWMLAWEWQARRTPPLMAENWAVRVVAVTGMFALFLPAMYFVMADANAGAGGALGILAFAGAVVALLRYYGSARRDRFMLTLAGTAAMALLTVAVGRLLFDLLDVGTLGLFMMAAFVVWQITWGVKLYRRTRAT